MKIQHLKAFVTVASTLNFRRAAEILCMTQPPLSHAIKALEENIGVTLLDRRQKKNVRLTPAGESFLLAAQRILQDIDRAKRTAQLADQGDFGSLTIGYSDDYVYGTFPDLINSYNLEYPNTSLYAYQDVSYQLITKLNRHEADCIFTTQPLNKPLSGNKTAPWPSTPIIAMMPEAHPLSGRTGVYLEELVNDRFLMMSQNTRTRFDDQINHLLTNAGINPHVTIEIMYSTLCAEMVRRGYGIALASRDSIPPYQEGLKVLTIKDKGASLTRLISWREENDNPSLQQFLQMAQTYNSTHQS